MSVGTYDTHELIGVVRRVPAPNLFWLNLCFNQEVLFDSEYIDFDIVDKGRRLAPFVSPMAQGKPMRQEGYSTRRFKPAYIKPKDNVDPRRLIKRSPGEMIGGDMTMEARRNAAIADITVTQRDMILRRLEWMAAAAILDDQVVIAGEDYPSVTVTFGRPSNQTLALLTTDAWDDTGKLDVLDDLDDWMIRVQRASGYAPTKCIMGLDAWGTFKEKAQVKEKLDTRRGSTAAMETALGNGEAVQFRGTIGPLEFWTYAEIYEDNSGSVVDMMDSESLVLINPAGIEGVRCFGAILDPKAGYRPASIWPKNFYSEDPPAEFVMSQSAPLMVPKRPAAAMRVKVIDN
jgi:Phage major capsid protein E